jgi:hypothetical protein
MLLPVFLPILLFFLEILSKCIAHSKFFNSVFRP